MKHRLLMCCPTNAPQSKYPESNEHQSEYCLGVQHTSRTTMIVHEAVESRHIGKRDVCERGKDRVLSGGRVAPDHAQHECRKRSIRSSL
jgi:hypothetical protein